MAEKAKEQLTEAAIKQRCRKVIAGKTVAVDLDGVLAEYEGWKGVYEIGAPLDGAVEFVKDLLDFGFNVCVWTTRVNPSVNFPADAGREHLSGDQWHRRLVALVENWLNGWGFPPLGDRFWIHDQPGKPIATAYIDDRAVACYRQAAGWGPTEAYPTAITGVLELALRDCPGASQSVCEALIGGMAIMYQRSQRAFDQADRVAEGETLLAVKTLEHLWEDIARRYHDVIGQDEALTEMEARMADGFRKLSKLVGGETQRRSRR